MNFQNRISFQAGKRSGKPTIRGLRITVYDVLAMLAQGMTTEQVLEDFPELEKEDVMACLAFAAERERTVSVLTN
jgi:uncharacterized protein (DUF433 family)